MNANKNINVNLKPYDDSMWDKHSMYDNITYTMDPDIKAEKLLSIVTGNIIKSYRCQMIDTYEVRHEG